jgi:hypothetical protein
MVTLTVIAAVIITAHKMEEDSMAALMVPSRYPSHIVCIHGETKV